MRKAMVQALVIASLLGMSTVGASAKTMGDFNMRGGKSGHDGTGQKAGASGASNGGSDSVLTTQSQATFILPAQDLSPAGRWVDRRPFVQTSRASYEPLPPKAAMFNPKEYTSRSGSTISDTH
jgi:hypothetical protein